MLIKVRFGIEQFLLNHPNFVAIQNKCAKLFDQLNLD